MQLIKNYRTQNGLPEIEALNLVIDTYLCGLPENKHRCIPTKYISRSLMGYIKGGVVLVKNLWYRFTATQFEADERALQCSTCKFNKFPNKGIFIKTSDQLAEASVGNKRSAHYDELGSCTVCSCPLRAKVWYKDEATFSPKEIEQFKEVNCWQLKLIPKKD